MSNRLDEIRTRARSATLPPWVRHHVSASGHKYSTCEIPGLGFREDSTTTWDDLLSSDQSFIAHAREDIPYLLARVERLGKALRTISLAHADDDHAIHEIYMAGGMLAFIADAQEPDNV